jgi:hypothetical protein
VTKRLPKRELTPRQRAFIQAYAETGSGPAAARKAGYQCSKPHNARTQAYRLLRDPVILAALREEVERRFRAGVVVAQKVMIDLAEDRTAPPEVRLKAAAQILDRGGMRLLPPEAKHAHLHLHGGPAAELSDADLIARIRALQRELGLLGGDATPALPAPATREPTTIDMAPEPIDSSESANGDGAGAATRTDGRGKPPSSDGATSDGPSTLDAAPLAPATLDDVL